MNVRLNDGTVRCPEHFDASTYDSDTTDPCLYCTTTPSDDQLWEEAVAALNGPESTRTLRLGKTRPCDRCAGPATWKITDGLSLDFLCTDHGTEWFPHLFTPVTVSN